MQMSSELSSKAEIETSLNDRLEKVLKAKDFYYPRFKTIVVGKKMGGRGFDIWQSMKKFRYDQAPLECADCDYRPA
jgi:hypothetical protein